MSNSFSEEAKRQMNFLKGLNIKSFKETGVFSDDLSFGQKREKIFLENYVTHRERINQLGGAHVPDFIFDGIFRWDLKSDRFAAKTGNFYFETSCWGKPSGVFSEKCPIEKLIVEVYQGEGFDANRFHIFDTEVVRKILSDKWYQKTLLKNQEVDGGKNQGFLAKIEDFLEVYSFEEMSLWLDTLQ